MKVLIDLASLSSWRDLSIHQCLRLSSQPFLTGIVEKFPRTIHFTIILHISFLKDISISLHFAGKMNFVTEHSRPTLLARSQLHTIIYGSPDSVSVREHPKKEEASPCNCHLLSVFATTVSLDHHKCTNSQEAQRKCTAIRHGGKSHVSVWNNIAFNCTIMIF